MKKNFLKWFLISCFSIIISFGLSKIAKSKTPNVPSITFNSELVYQDSYTYRVFTNQNGIYVINLTKERLEIKYLKNH